MHVLITGGAGYIGSHTAKVLARAGHQPVVLDNLAAGHASAVKWGPLIRGDCGDGATVAEALRAHRVEAVMHFAASAYVGESMREPRVYFRNNVTQTLLLLDAVLDAGVPYFVFSSSCAIYGTPARVPILEEDLPQPVNPYGESKLFVERALGWYGQAYGLKWVALRYFNAAGADPDSELCERHEPETHLIPLAIRAALREQPLEIYGADYPTPDGTAIRDYVHVMDLADAHRRALEYLVQGGASLTMNLGTARGYSVREVLEAVARICGRPPAARVTGRRPGDPAVLVADAARAAAVLAWHPRLSSLDEIVRTAARATC